MHNTPIYLADVEIKIVKIAKNNSQIEQRKFLLKELVVKGFYFQNIIDISQKIIFREAAKVEALTKSKEFDYKYIVSDIALIKQIGYSNQ
jgi:hypothetical protein